MIALQYWNSFFGGDYKGKNIWWQYERKKNKLSQPNTEARKDEDILEDDAKLKKIYIWWQHM